MSYSEFVAHTKPFAESFVRASLQSLQGVKASEISGSALVKLVFESEIETAHAEFAERVRNTAGVVFVEQSRQ